MNSIEVPNRKSLDDVGRLPSEKTTGALDGVEINRNLDRFFMVSAALNPANKQQLISFLLSNHDIFAWTSYEMPSIDPSISQHRLNVDPKCKPIIQKSQRLATEHTAAVVEEVDRLFDARAIREVTYPTWLSNTVVVKKKSETWRVCIDFTDINKACPKDCFPLPRIDQLVDATVHHQRMTFLDAYEGYHQIAMHPIDQDKTAFLTPEEPTAIRLCLLG